MSNRSKLTGNLLMAGMLVGVVTAILLPWAVVGFVPSDAGMAATMVLLFVVDPLAFVAVGVMCAVNVRMLWPVPVVNALLFLFGANTYFSAGSFDAAFLIYVISYLAVAYFAMATVHYVRVKRNGR